MTKYIDGTTLANSTGVWENIELTTCSAAGFYSDGITVREQTVGPNGCTLLPPQDCDACTVDCGSAIDLSSTKGVYTLPVDAGASVGAVIIKIQPESRPDGIMATYDGSVYNKLSSPIEGLLQSSVAGVPTYIGENTADNCVSQGTYNNIPKFSYSSEVWVPNGTANVVVQNGQLEIGSVRPENSVMVIPKPSASPSTLEIEITGLCTGTAWDIDFSCPTVLTGVASSTTVAIASTACNSEYNTIYYHVPVNSASTPGDVNRHDYLFLDSNGVNPVTDGFYPLPNGNVVEIRSGIVKFSFSVCAVWTVRDCLTASTVVVRAEDYGFSVGDIVQYELMIPTTGTDGNNKCGEIISGAISGATTAVIMNPNARACNDATNCPQ
tara:strand:- start:2972 stop:4114 length:1143 start_codon:yes stop_codon:yes gene_type:complete